MALQYISTSNSGWKNNVSSISFNHTVAAGSNRILIVGVGMRNGASNPPIVSGITFNGVALTKIRADEESASKNLRSELWYLIAPDEGTYSVVITLDAASVDSIGIAHNWTGADQASPINANAGGSVQNDADGMTTAITTDVDNCYLMNMWYSTANVVNIATDDTEIVEVAMDATSNDSTGAAYALLATAGASSMGITWNELFTSTVQSIAAIAPEGTSASSNRSAKLTGESTATAAVSTVGSSAVEKTTATLIGEISEAGSTTITERGFEYNTVAYPDKKVYSTGDFGAGQYTLDIGYLSPNTTYYFRAYVIDGGGTAYGSWQSLTTDPSSYSVVINAIDRTADVLNQSIQIEDALNDKQNVISFALIDRSGNGIPDPDEEITITMDDGTKIFAGYLTEVSLDKSGGEVRATIRGTDYARLLDRNLVHRSYEDMTDKAIIEDIVDRYCAGSGITTTNVLEGVTVDQISFNYVQPSQAIRKLAALTGRNWYIDYDKDIHYFPNTTDTAPFDIDSSNAQYANLKISKDANQIKNRVYVRGGTKLSDSTVYSVKGDGVMTKFVLPDKPHDVSVTVNGAAKTLGIKNIDTSGFDWYLNFQEKYLEQDSGGGILATTDTLAVTYKYDIPILVALENTASIEEHGQHEFAIFDKQIATTQAARDRASAELTDYANNVIEGSFTTYTTGFKSGQYINIALSDYSVGANYLVQKVAAQSLGSGLFTYTIEIASVKTMGIIKFLIQLLEANRNIITLDDNEVVDELFNIADLLISDSLVEQLTIDSAGAYRTWAIDENETTATRAIWNLFEWGGNS